MEEIIASYENDGKATELLQQLSVDPDAKPKCQLIQGIIRYKGCIWIGNHPELHAKVFSSFHDSPVGEAFRISYHLQKNTLTVSVGWHEAVY